MITDADKQHMTVGLKQTLRAIENGNVNKVFLAEDCDSSIRVSVETAASNANASMFYVKTRSAQAVPLLKIIDYSAYNTRNNIYL